MTSSEVDICKVQRDESCSVLTTKNAVPVLSELSLYQPLVQIEIKTVVVKFFDLLDWIFTGWQLYKPLCARGRSSCWDVQLRSERKGLCTCSVLKEKHIFLPTLQQHSG